MTASQFLALIRPSLSHGMLTNRQFALLALCASLDKPIRVKQAALNLTISRPAVSRATDALSIKNFVRRKREEKDTRQVQIHITPQGTAFLESLGVS